jgi:hypothetical protein
MADGDLAAPGSLDERLRSRSELEPGPHLLSPVTSVGVTQGGWRIGDRVELGQVTSWKIRAVPV